MSLRGPFPTLQFYDSRGRLTGLQVSLAGLSAKPWLTILAVIEFGDEGEMEGDLPVVCDLELLLLQLPELHILKRKLHSKMGGRKESACLQQTARKRAPGGSLSLAPGSHLRDCTCNRSKCHLTVATFALECPPGALQILLHLQLPIATGHVGWG